LNIQSCCQHPRADHCKRSERQYPFRPATLVENQSIQGKGHTPSERSLEQADENDSSLENDKAYEVGGSGFDGKFSKGGDYAGISHLQQ
jgi:hypothetical protein